MGHTSYLKCLPAGLTQNFVSLALGHGKCLPAVLTQNFLSLALGHGPGKPRLDIGPRIAGRGPKRSVLPLKLPE